MDGQGSLPSSGPCESRVKPVGSENILVRRGEQALPLTKSAVARRGQQRVHDGYWGAGEGGQGGEGSLQELPGQLSRAAFPLRRSLPFGLLGLWTRSGKGWMPGDPRAL